MSALHRREATQDPGSYGSRFQTAQSVQRYLGLYAPHTYDSLMWSLERRQLVAALERSCPDSSARVLDFATGTGRILSCLATTYQDVAGIDVSPGMISEAKRIVPSARLIVRDVTVDGCDDLGTFKAITCFRFALNAGPRLRDEVFTALRSLVDADGVVVINNHGNSLSVRGCAHVWYRAKRLRDPGLAPEVGAVLRHRQLLGELRAAGLEPVQTCGCGLLGSRLYRVVPRAVAERIEAWAARHPTVGRFCVSRMYVLRLAAKPT